MAEQQRPKTKLEAALTANGVSCRTCSNVGDATAMEPMCRKYTLQVSLGIMGDTTPISRFAANVRAMEGDCGPMGKGYTEQPQQQNGEGTGHGDERGG
jgi:hypothetical protein